MWWIIGVVVEWKGGEVSMWKAQVRPSLAFPLACALT